MKDLFEKNEAPARERSHKLFRMNHFEDQLDNNGHKVGLTQVLTLFWGKKNMIKICLLFIPLLIFCFGASKREISKDHFEAYYTQ